MIKSHRPDHGTSVSTRPSSTLSSLKPYWVPSFHNCRTHQPLHSISHFALLGFHHPRIPFPQQNGNATIISANWLPPISYTVCKTRFYLGPFIPHNSVVSSHLLYAIVALDWLARGHPTNKNNSIKSILFCMVASWILFKLLEMAYQG